MKLILTEDIQHVGTIGDLVTVKPGYARNYLIPRSMAIPASSSNTKQMEHQKRMLAKRQAKVLKELNVIADKIAKLKVEIPKQVGEEERIFGSVTTLEIAEILKSHSLEISRKDISLTEDVKKLGVYTADIRLHTSLTAKLKFWVVAQS